MPTAFSRALTSYRGLYSIELRENGVNILEKRKEEE